MYDEAAADVLELGRITVWEPGARLAWQSSVDDVEIDVRFEATAGGTRVVLAAYLPAGGTDIGGTSWVTMSPGWFGRWCARRDTAPRAPRELDRLAVAVRYAKPATAARWLQAAFGFEEVAPIPPGDEGQMWIEFRVGNCSLIVLRLDDDLADSVPVTHVPWVFVDDLDAHGAQAQAAGATVVEPIHQHGYRAYTAADLEGHPWTFAQARPGMLGGGDGR